MNNSDNTNNAVIIIGACGFVGFSLIRYLFEQYSNKFKLVGVDRNIYTDKHKLMHNECFYLEADIVSDKCSLIPNLKNYVTEKQLNISCIIHLASISRIKDYKNKGDVFCLLRNNIVSVINAIEIASIFDCPIIILGTHEEIYKSSAYGFSRLLIDYISNYCKNKFFNKIIFVRSFNIYGLGDIIDIYNPEKLTVLDAFCYYHRNLKPLKVLCPVVQTRRYTHVDDACYYLANIINDCYKYIDRDSIVIPASRPISLQEIINNCFYDYPIELLQARPGEYSVNNMENEWNGRKLSDEENEAINSKVFTYINNMINLNRSRKKYYCFFVNSDDIIGDIRNQIGSKVGYYNNESENVFIIEWTSKNNPSKNYNYMFLIERMLATKSDVLVYIDLTDGKPGLIIYKKKSVECISSIPLSIDMYFKKTDTNIVYDSETLMDGNEMKDIKFTFLFNYEKSPFENQKINYNAWLTKNGVILSKIK